MSWLETRFDSRTDVQPDGVVLYRVQIDVLNSSGIEKEIFVFNTNLDTFEHVSSVYEMNTIPPSPGQSLAQNTNYYRAGKVLQTFLTSTAAVAFINDVKTRITRLRYQWDEFTTSPFGGVETVIFSSEN